MKNVILSCTVIVVLLSFSSCTKKEYYCKCYFSSGALDWEGSVDATSKEKAEKIVEEDTGHECMCE
jgi:hypothetical protein